ncbi:hypothetical protein HS088_TW11G00137 [Tripterygium wilfordii]|uniref:Transmembrane protein n=1 Tax=Tripterygium wilfordii TaxID=458696 RepID=A0A7J7D172_TRIWF|nr:hypothetical protein HS088_TW11G00137 [Tripterygium wilfordii]
MQKPLSLKTNQYFLLENPILLNGSTQCTIFPPKSPSFHFQLPFICAGKKKRQSGSRKFTKFVLDSLPIIALNLKIIPQPFDLVIEEFAGGNGGGLGFWKGLGGGFNWWRRGRKKNLELLLFVVVFGLWVFWGRELRNDLFWGISGLGLFWAVLRKEWRRVVNNLVFGICCFGVLVCLGLRKGELTKCVQKIGISSPNPQNIKSRKSSCKRRTL